MVFRAGAAWRGAVLVSALAALAGRVSAESYVLPSSSFLKGSNDAEYRTDLRILNQGTTAVTVHATFYDQVTSAPVAAAPFRIEARSQAAFDNVLASLFGKSLVDGAYGPIRLESTGPILAAASVNNVNACRSGAVSGQWLPGLAVSKALTSGVIGQLATSASPAEGYRTNLVFVNPGDRPATVTARLRRGGGALLSEQTIGPLAANGFRQLPIVSFAGVAATTDTDLWLEFASNEPVLAYATIIHNVSGDPFAVVAVADTPPAAPEELTYTLPGEVPLVLVKVPAGAFQMGAPETEEGTYDAEQPVHPVTLSRGYWIGKYEVTQAQWQAVMGTNPSYYGACGPGCPVERVSWNDVRGTNGFLERLRTLVGDAKLRLPTEAEWERAARAGTQTRFHFGDAATGSGYCGGNADAEPYLWWCGNAGGVTHEVGTRLPNAFGLHDMSGNVWEIVEDWFGSYSPAAQTDPAGPSAGTRRSARGGGQINLLQDARSAVRDGVDPSDRFSTLGVRLCRSE